MADLDPAHVEAVAQVLFDVQGFEDCPAAEAILASTDPDIHASMLAALVRAGVLREDETWTTTDETGATIHVGFGQCSRTPRRRYVTRWEDA